MKILVGILAVFILVLLGGVGYIGYRLNSDEELIANLQINLGHQSEQIDGLKAENGLLNKALKSEQKFSDLLAKNVIDIEKQIYPAPSPTDYQVPHPSITTYNITAGN